MTVKVTVFWCLCVLDYFTIIVFPRWVTSLWRSLPPCFYRHYLSTRVGSGTCTSGDCRTRTRRRSGTASRCRRCWSAFGSDGRWIPVCRRSWSPPCCPWWRRDRCRRSGTASWGTGPETDTCSRCIRPGTWRKKNGNVFNSQPVKGYCSHTHRVK